MNCPADLAGFYRRTFIYPVLLVLCLVPAGHADEHPDTVHWHDIGLTQQERDWLRQNPVIRLGHGTDWAPIGFVNDKGEYSGIAADYMREISELLGTTLEPQYLKPWKTTVDAARRGEVDMLDSVAPTPQRKEFLTFTRPYLSYPLEIFAAKHGPYIANMSDLDGERVAVTAGSALHDILVNKHPEYSLVPVENARAGLIAVKNDEASAFIGNLLTTGHIISREGITSIKVAGETPYRYELTIGVNRHKPVLASVLQKALDAIPEEKHNEIYRRWMTLTFEQQVDYTPVLQAAALLIFMFISVLFWSRHRQVRRLEKEMDSRKQVELTLRDREVRFGTILDTVVDGIVTINTGGVIESFNPAAEGIFGYSAKDMIGRNVSILMPGYYAERHDGFIRRYVETGDAQIIGVGRELEARRRDGSVFPVELSVSEMSIDSERKFTGVIRDITERKLAEFELQQHKAHLEELVDRRTSELAEERERARAQFKGTPIPTYAWHREDDDFVLVDYNDAAMEVTGGGVRNLVGTRLSALYEDRPDIVADVWACFKSAEQLNREYWYDFKATEKRRYLSVTYGYSPKDIVLIHADDITERTQVESALKSAKEQAESASRSKSTFLASMSHELRTPLNVILGYARLLQNDEEVPHAQRESIRTIERSGQHLLEQISDILDVAKIESGKVELVPEVVNIRQFINYLRNYFLSAADGKGLELECEIDDAVSRPIMVDARRLQQVLINLIGNAIKFTDTGRVTIRVEPGRLSLPESEHDVCLEFSVEDTGIGMTRDEAMQVFEPFVVLGRAGDPNEGTGLGLSIAQQLVHLMGSGIRVDTSPDKGSRFWFEIVVPFSDEEPVTHIPGNILPASYRGDKNSILVVDDISDNRNMLRDMLTRSGFKVVTASQGRDAAIIARDMHPDLILMDLLMPLTDGYEALALLGTIPECKDIPVIAMSASVGEREPALEAGFYAFLPKPVSTSDLGALLAEVLELEWLEQADEPADQVDVGDLPGVSAEECTRLQTWARLGKMRSIIDWAQALETRSPRYSAFGQRVIRLARNIDKAGLKSLFDSLAG